MRVAIFRVEAALLMHSGGFWLLRSCQESTLRYICIRRIYSLGDSIADTGNLIRQGADGAFASIAHLPYDQTSFGKPTGRCSNCLLMIDYLAKALDLPLVQPNLDKNGDFTHGANFAVAGVTTLSSSFFQKRGIKMLFTNSFLNVQFERFKKHLNSTHSSSSERAKMLKKSLVLVGEIGGNDYNYAFLAGKSANELTTSVPFVVQAIADATREHGSSQYCTHLGQPYLQDFEYQEHGYSKMEHGKDTPNLVNYATKYKSAGV